MVCNNLLPLPSAQEIYHSSNFRDLPNTRLISSIFHGSDCLPLPRLMDRSGWCCNWPKNKYLKSVCVCFCENVGTTPLSAHHTKGSPTTDFGLFSCWCLIFSTVVNHHAGNMFFLTVWSKSKVRSGGGKCLWFHSYSTGAHGTPPWKTTNALPRK